MAHKLFYAPMHHIQQMVPKWVRVKECRLCKILPLAEAMEDALLANAPQLTSLLAPVC